MRQERAKAIEQWYDSIVAENERMPVAVRIIRPYNSEEAFLENELDTVSKTSVILLGARARPVGTILRFEMMLANGAMLLRGEGRVLSHGESAFGGEHGLTLRFTRLDLRSKALVDRVQSIRDRAPFVQDAIAIRDRTPVPVPVRPKTMPPPSTVSLRIASSVPPLREDSVAEGRVLVPPPDREGLLDRLRKRASGLDADRIRAILGAREAPQSPR